MFSVQSFSNLFLSAQTTLILLEIFRFNTFCVFSVHSYLAAACSLRCYFVVNKPHVVVRQQTRIHALQAVVAIFCCAAIALRV
jgi:hypothetical protein